MSKNRIVKSVQTIKTHKLSRLTTYQKKRKKNFHSKKLSKQLKKMKRKSLLIIAGYPCLKEGKLFVILNKILSHIDLLKLRK